MTKRSWILLGLLASVAVAAPIVRSSGSFEVGFTGVDSAVQSLPYLTWVPADETADHRGVTVYDVESSQPGLNLYSPRESHRAFLLDMEGHPLHRWDRAVDEDDTWQLVEPLADGELLVVVSDRRLLHIDRDSEILWTLERRVHHDVALSGTGDIFVLAVEERYVQREGRSWPILDDVILRLTPAGEVTAKLSIYDLFGERVPQSRWNALDKWLQSEEGVKTMSEPPRADGKRLTPGANADLFHTNSIEVLPRDLPGVAPAGTLLISIRNISLVAIVDFDRSSIEWTWGPGVVNHQHHPSLLENDNILVYDNLGGRGGTSRIVELDPRRGEIVWEYDGEPPDSFHSDIRGGCQRLANGNTLITESDTGRVFEVRADGELVWEFFNPVTRDGGRERSAIYRMMRLPVDGAPWLAEAARGRRSSGTGGLPNDR